MVWRNYGISDEMASIFIPLALYWIYGGIFELLPNTRLDKIRLHTRKEEYQRNLVSKGTVIKRVLMQQVIQASFGVVAFTLYPEDHRDQPSVPLQVLQIIVAMLVMDTWQYFVHRYMHVNKFLFRTMHAQHHRLVVPFAYGAMFNHPLEGFILESVGGAVAYIASGMTPLTSVYFFSFATIKGVDDHCGVWLPGNLLQLVFQNNAAYHDVHHQMRGKDFNYSQPFFTHWDKLLGTYMPFKLENRAEEGGGYEARPVKLGKRKTITTELINLNVKAPGS